MHQKEKRRGIFGINLRKLSRDGYECRFRILNANGDFVSIDENTCEVRFGKARRLSVYSVALEKQLSDAGTILILKAVTDEGNRAKFLSIFP